MLALVLLLRYSGLRMGDAASLQKARIDIQGSLFLYTAKSGPAVKLPLPPVVIQALAECEPVSERHWFWTGRLSKSGSKETLTGNWRRTFRRLFKLAGVDRGHAYTLAVELLNPGTPIERVSKLLGHKSVRVPEKHYAAWVRERQEQAEADERRSWKGDPVAMSVQQRPQRLLHRRETERRGQRSTCFQRLNLVSRAGLEPATTALKVRCSTN